MNDIDELKVLKSTVARLEGEVARMRERATGVALARWRQRMALWLGTAGLCLLPVLGWAAVSLTEFQAGDPIVAAEVNGNFEALAAAISELQDSSSSISEALTAVEERTSYVRGDFCGVAGPIDGDMGGYPGANQLCRDLATRSATTAHICNTAELHRLAGDGVDLPEGWIATLNWSQLNNGNLSNDCSGFNSASAMSLGHYWSTNSPSAITLTCDIARDVLCCDS